MSLLLTTTGEEPPPIEADTALVLDVRIPKLLAACKEKLNEKVLAWGLGLGQLALRSAEWELAGSVDYVALRFILGTFSFMSTYLRPASSK